MVRHEGRTVSPAKAPACRRALYAASWRSRACNIIWIRSAHIIWIRKHLQSTDAPVSIGIGLLCLMWRMVVAAARRQECMFEGSAAQPVCPRKQQIHTQQSS